jgi:hypothetical protein
MDTNSVFPVPYGTVYQARAHISSECHPMATKPRMDKFILLESKSTDSMRPWTSSAHGWHGKWWYLWIVGGFNGNIRPYIPAKYGLIRYSTSILGSWNSNWFSIVKYNSQDGFYIFVYMLHLVLSIVFDISTMYTARACPSPRGSDSVPEATGRRGLIIWYVDITWRIYDNIW